MNKQTAKLTGHLLNYAVALAEGVDAKGVLYTWQGQAKLKIQTGETPCEYTEVTFNYAGDWAQGGWIIEREKITVWWATHFIDDEGVEYGNHWYAEGMDGHVQAGATPLEAAMRCYVASKLGKTVEIPDELTMLGG